MAFVREIGRNGVKEGKKQRQKRDINDIPMNICAIRACYGKSNRIEANRKINQLIESIKFHINDITTHLHLHRVQAAGKIIYEAVQLENAVNFPEVLLFQPCYPLV